METPLERVRRKINASHGLSSDNPSIPVLRSDLEPLVSLAESVDSFLNSESDLFTAFFSNVELHKKLKYLTTKEK